MNDQEKNTQIKISYTASVFTAAGAIMKTTFSARKITYNGIKGWVVEMRINGVFSGCCVRRTKAAAIEQLCVWKTEAVEMKQLLEINPIT